MTSGLMLGLLAETFVHPGSGQTHGAIDLRVARESTTDYPFVPGSALKGALKSHFEDHKTLANVETVFGTVEGAGTVLVSDARLLLLPIRSLSKAYVWVTCPLILERLARDRRRLGLPCPSLEAALQNMPAFTAEEMLSAGAKPNDRVFLEERLITVADRLPGFAGRSEPGPVVATIAGLIPGGHTRDRLADHLAIVADATFGWFARNALPVQARNVLEKESKASRNLWYEETLAPDTLMYATLSPRGGANGGFSDLEVKVPDLKYLQVGGNETVGQGWMAVTPFDPSATSGTAGAAREAAR